MSILAAAIAIIIILLIIAIPLAIGFFVARALLGRKIGRVKAGVLGVFIVFCGLYGEEAVRYVYFRGLCTFKAKSEIYDQVAYDRFNKTYQDKKHTKPKGKELTDIMGKAGIRDYVGENVTYDPENNIISFNVQQHNNNLLHVKTINLNNHAKVREYKNYYSQGGWLCRALDYSGGGCRGNSSCASNHYGPFKNIKY